MKPDDIKEYEEYCPVCDWVYLKRFCQDNTCPSNHVLQKSERVKE